jgi:type IV pilus assembly protein PilE
LIELIIAMVIGAILVALALPSFMGSIRKGRRSEAMAGLTTLQQEQERWRSNNSAYTESLTDLRITSPTRPGNYYTLTVKSGSATATGYEAIADGSASSQSSDGACAKLAVKAERGNISYASCSGCSSFTYSATNVCWSR